MVTSQIERRIYRVPQLALFGACLTALGYARAVIERQDVERGVIVATLGGGVLMPASALVLTIRPESEGSSELTASWRARGFGRGGRAVRAFLETVEALIAAA